MGQDNVRLSKAMARALRHAPEDYGLELDADGWASVEDLLAALMEHRTAWQRLTLDDIHGVVENSSKKRYELKNGMIRAYYGHSIEQHPHSEPEQPPKLLYHGTKRAALDAILRDGLKPMNRQFVHLASELETAGIVAARHKGDSVMLAIHAAEAHQNGVLFYHGNESTWLAEFIPAQFIEELTSLDR